MENKNIRFVTSFILKILAIVFMTIDHVGVILEMNVGSNYWLALTFRGIGRLALPLFCFMITEGVLHTKNFSKYMLRLGIIGTLVLIAMIGIEYLPIFDGMSMRNDGNIFIDLILGALCVYLLNKKEWYYKLLSIAPFAISLLSFIVTCIEYGDVILIHWYPFFLRGQYHFYAVTLMIGFYAAHIFSNMFLKKYSDNSGIPVESLKDTVIERRSLNIFFFGVSTIVTLGYFILSLIMNYDYVYWDNGLQNFAIISGAFLLLYNGKRGYNAKWFQYGCYLYYPIHLLVIYGLGMLI